jgi:hypothetical protein
MRVPPSERMIITPSHPPPDGTEKHRFASPGVSLCRHLFSLSSFTENTERKTKNSGRVVYTRRAEPNTPARHYRPLPTRWLYEPRPCKTRGHAGKMTWNRVHPNLHRVKEAFRKNGYTT